MKKITLITCTLFFINAFLAQESLDTTIVYFNVDSHIPNHEFEWVADDNLTSLSIIDFMDTTGSEDRNNDLAELRARSVLSHIDTTQISSDLKISLEGETSKFGELEKNRCVLIVSKLIEVVEIVESERLDINFQFIPGTANLNSTSIIELKKHLDSIKDFNFKSIEIHGHVCCFGDYNLSLNRTLKVKKYFLYKGVEEKRIKCYGHSNEIPLVEEITEADKQKNRRVEVVLLR